MSYSPEPMDIDDQPSPSSPPKNDIPYSPHSPDPPSPNLSVDIDARQATFESPHGTTPLQCTPDTGSTEETPTTHQSLLTPRTPPDTGYQSSSSSSPEEDTSPPVIIRIPKSPRIFSNLSKADNRSLSPSPSSIFSSASSEGPSPLVTDSGSSSPSHKPIKTYGRQRSNSLTGDVSTSSRKENEWARGGWTKEEAEQRMERRRRRMKSASRSRSRSPALGPAWKDDTSPTPGMASSSKLQLSALPRTPSPKIRLRGRASFLRPFRPLNFLSRRSSPARPTEGKSKTNEDGPKRHISYDPYPADREGTIAVSALATERLGTHCSGCLLDPKSKIKKELAEGRIKSVEQVRNAYLRCGRCQSVYNCSLKCCASTAMAHFAECRAMLRCEDEVPSTEIRLLAKMFIERSRGKPKKLAPHNLSTLTPQSIKELSEVHTELSSYLVKCHDYEREVNWREYHLKSDVEAAIYIRQLRARMAVLKDHEGRSIGMCILEE